MKKFNRIIIFTIITYCLLAMMAGFVVMNMHQQDDQYYRVEINRIMHELNDGKPVQTVSVNQYEMIEDIQFLDVKKMNEQNTKNFFTVKNQKDSMIQPLYQDGTLNGYVKFYYTTKADSTMHYQMIVQGCLFVGALFILLLLWYLRKHIVKPFHELNDLPMQIASGHLKAEVKVEKSGYFRQFLWGMGQLKDNLDVSRKRQLELEKEKKQMLLSLSHDIKTPLNLIKLYGKALEDDLCADPESQQQAIHRIKEKADEIDHYVDAIMKTSREDILGLKVEVGEFYLRDLLDKVLKVYREQCSIRNIHLDVRDYQDCIVKGDIERAQEVLENLFENAFKYGDGSQIRIEVYEEEECQLVKVFNTGTGMSDHELNHVFDSFFRGVNSQGKSGSGLGLYICKELMRKMDGDIFVQQSNEGMAFVLVFR